MCNDVVAPTSSTTVTSSLIATPTPEILFPLWSSTKYGKVPSYALDLSLSFVRVLSSAVAIYCKLCSCACVHMSVCVCVQHVYGVHVCTSRSSCYSYWFHTLYKFSVF